MAAFLRAGQFSHQDFVLDVGTGTGIIPSALSEFGVKCVGVDSSEDMLQKAASKGIDGSLFLKADLRELPFLEGTFSRVTARMVFHHVLSGIDQAMNECYRVLNPGGMLVLSEGVPPHRKVQERYEEIFRLKEERRTFFEEDLIALFEQSHFQEIELHTFVEPQVSVMNWLRSANLPESVQEEIFRLHIEADDFFKSVYNMTITEDDCLIDMKFAIVTGRRA